MTVTPTRPAARGGRARFAARVGSFPSAPPDRSAAGELTGLLGSGVLTAARAVLTGLFALGIVAVLLWCADPRSGSGLSGVLPTVGQLWLLGHGVTLRLPTGVIGLAPLGLLALAVGVLARAARRCARARQPASLVEAGRLAAAIAVPYAAAAGVLAVLVTANGVRPAIGQAVLGGAVVGVAGAGAGVLRSAGRWPGVGPAGSPGVGPAGSPGVVAARAARVIVGAAGAVTALLGAGALLVALSLGGHLGRALDLASATGPGAVGGAGLFLLDVLLLPNAMIWGAAWLAGPGFAVGVGTAVGPFATRVGAVPGLPLAAALPATGAPAWLTATALLVPVAAGAMAARLVQHRGGGWLDVLLVAPLTGLLAGMLAALSGGPLGVERLRVVGPVGWQVGLAVTVEIAAGGCLALAGLRRRLRSARVAQ